MKSYISKLILGAAAIAGVGMMSSCVDDLDQMPKDPATVTPSDMNNNAKQMIAGLMAKCYNGLAISGNAGAGESDIAGADAGMGCYSRSVFQLNEFPTDEAAWIYFSDAGLQDLVQSTWSSGNPIIYLVYSRYYTHIAVCNDFIRNMRDNLGDWGIKPDEELQNSIDQFVLEARALRAYSYYNVIDQFGRAAVAWDDAEFGQVPPQAESRAALFHKVVNDLEEVLAEWDNVHSGPVIYGRIGKDAVEALLCRFYLNAEVFTEGETSGWQKCWEHAQNIINRHKGSGYLGSGLAEDYLALFASNNHQFMPGGSRADQNEILFGTPYDKDNIQAYGGTNFLVFSAIVDNGAADPAKDDAYFCNKGWYGSGSAWGCMHAREQFSQKFNFENGASADGRAYLWLTEKANWNITNDNANKLNDGYSAIKFTNVPSNADGTMTRKYIKWGNKDIPALEVPADYNVNNAWVDTDLPVIRLADVYLMAAECTLHGVGNQADAVTYVNYLRKRAGVAEWQAHDLSASNILDERARELYWENVRRTDLIRFGLFTGSEYVWNWKNGTNPGTQMAGSFMNVFPIPASIISSYPAGSFEQNPGY